MGEKYLAPTRMLLFYNIVTISVPRVSSSQMSEAREFDTNMSTACGFNPDAPWVDGVDRQKNIIPKMEGEEDFQQYQDVDEPHQESEPDEEVPDWVPTEAEKDAASRLREMTKEPRPAKAVKRPRSPLPEDDVPDLAEIFDNYDTPYPVRISICRAYASYLASMQPKKPRAKKPVKQ